MKRLLIRSLLLWGALCGGVQAVTLHVADGKLTGASGVEVNGQLYDVEFLDGSCIELFDGCDSVDDFAFNDPAGAHLAAEALLNQVFVDDASPDLGDFDSEPQFTRGCEDAAGCAVLTPWDVTVQQVITFASGNRTFTDTGVDADFVFLVDRLRTSGTIDEQRIVYAVWEVTQVPEPGTALLLPGAALAWLAGSRRRRRA
jgi:hypothetical protein